MRIYRKLAIIITILSLTLSLANCSYDDSLYSSNDDSISLDSLMNINQKTAKNRQVNGSQPGATIRGVALYEMALSMGMRAGLYNRALEINRDLAQNSTILDDIFDFRELILENRIVPPVLIEARKTMDTKQAAKLPTNEDAFLLNNNPVGKSLAEAKVRVEKAQNNFISLRITDQVYKIIKQARFAVTLPSWRDYLRLDYSKPMPPEPAVLPKDEKEQVTWAKGIQDGWKMGLSQADQIFVQNLMLLRRDYLGMLRYRKLLSMNMVSAPYVAKRQYGVTGDGDQIKINDKVLTITALPALNIDSKNWRPYMIQSQEQELDNKLAQLGIDKVLKYLPDDSTFGPGGTKTGRTGRTGRGIGKGFINPKEVFNK